MDELRALVKGVVADLAKKRKAVDFERAQRLWSEAVGAVAAPHTQIVYLTKNKIRVNVDSSAWLYTLNLKKEKIARTLKKTLHIDELRLRLGPVEAGENPFGKRGD